jgi:beta-lactamase regulating signal transducer with metallopeptidase domain
MNTDWLMEDLGRGVAMWLAHGVWQASVVTLVAGTALTLLRRHPARVRYAVGCLALALLVVMPSATLLLSSSTPPDVASLTDVAAGSQGTSFQAGSQAIPEAVIASRSKPSTTGESSPLLAKLPWLLVALWLVGTGVGLLRLVLGWRRAGRKWIRPATPASTGLRQTVSHVAERLGLRRPVRVLESPFVPSPLVLGVVRPLLVLPRGMSEKLSPEQLEAVLAHELDHVRRHDPSANLAQYLVETLFFFHPAARWLSSRVRMEREHCCDDTAVRLCGNARLYSGALLELEELRQEGLALGAGAHPLAARVRRLLGHAPVETPRKARRAARVGGALATLAFSGAAWAWEAPDELHSNPPAKSMLATAMCTQAVYPKDFTAIATYENAGRTIRSRLFVSRCGRIRLEPADGAPVQALLYDVRTLARVSLDEAARTYDSIPESGDFGLPLHLPGGCAENQAGCRLQGQDDVAGRRAQRWVRVHAPHDTVTQWVDAELGYPIRESSDLFGTMTLTDIKIGEQDSKRLVIPSDFKVLSIR